MAEPKKYVGMRYVPKFAEPLEWNTNNKYEPLEMVLHEGNYYISRQFVPMDIDILNKEYWLPFALTLDGAAGLVSRVDSNTDAIIQNATALHEVENKATQNAMDIAGNKEDISTNNSLISINTKNISLNNKIIDELLNHFIMENKRLTPSQGSGFSNLIISKDKKQFYLTSSIFSLPEVEDKIILAPPDTVARNNETTLFSAFHSTGITPYITIFIDNDGSIYTYKPNGGDSISGYIFVDFGIKPNVMTLPMTEEDYNNIESEVK